MVLDLLEEQVPPHSLSDLSRRLQAKSSRDLYHRTLLDVWEIVTYFGEEHPVSANDWAARFKPDVEAYATASNNRAWARLRDRIRIYCVPFEVRRPTHKDNGQAHAISFPSGTRATIEGILDRAERLREVKAGAALKTIEDSEGHVRRGVHLTIDCPTCGEPEGISCQAADSRVILRTTVHHERLKAALCAVEAGSVDPDLYRLQGL